ncbi:MAG: prepilin peptidase [Siculibacillus sp.]
MSEIALALVVALFPIVVVIAATTDFFTMTISNRLSAGLFVAGLAALALSSPTPETVGSHFAAAGAVFAVGFACFAFGWMGGGDVKFGAAVAFWLGWEHVLDYAVGFSVFGGLLTLAVLLSDRVTDPIPSLKVGFLARFHEHRRVPYGIALTAAALQVFPHTTWMRAFAAF